MAVGGASVVVAVGSWPVSQGVTLLMGLARAAPIIIDISYLHAAGLLVMVETCQNGGKQDKSYSEERRRADTGSWKKT